VIRTTPAYNYINKTRENPKCGAGVAIVIEKSLAYREISLAYYQQNVKLRLEMVFVQVMH
jgi:hypothetical protein